MHESLTVRQQEEEDEDSLTWEDLNVFRGFGAFFTNVT